MYYVAIPIPRSENYDADEHVMLSGVNPDHPMLCEGQQQQQQQQTHRKQSSVYSIYISLFFICERSNQKPVMRQFIGINSSQ